MFFCLLILEKFFMVCYNMRTNFRVSVITQESELHHLRGLGRVDSILEISSILRKEQNFPRSGYP